MTPTIHERSYPFDETTANGVIEATCGSLDVCDAIVVKAVDGFLEMMGGYFCSNPVG
jgi:hypothetical protein